MAYNMTGGLITILGCRLGGEVLVVWVERGEKFVMN